MSGIFFQDGFIRFFLAENVYIILNGSDFDIQSTIHRSAAVDAINIGAGFMSGFSNGLLDLVNQAGQRLICFIAGGIAFETEAIGQLQCMDITVSLTIIMHNVKII